MQNYAELMFNGGVGEIQKASGTYDKYRTAYRHRTLDAIDTRTGEFIEARNSFYIASVTSDGWPYIQHRGGERGFMQVVGDHKLACADYPGNRQFITMGNLQDEARVSLFFMDYLNQARLKVQGKATLVPAEKADPELVERVSRPNVETQRILEIDVVALDWNCPKYIPTLFSQENVLTILNGKLEELTEENAALKKQLAEKS